ncbi:ATP-dependent RNA helicase vasa-like isoform X1 [Leptopilina heterotoma]|uniref:ATP-dependent RNA helicase vasa-like isoform X1 n=2 Tax=Leptopilina heterotoma TaxID=63436 RepID=UPI001CA840AA|nr:ATP-dependent RNA helicase vasa-like isoform X1 [Leptopilina heterotoma]
MLLCISAFYSHTFFLNNISLTNMASVDELKTLLLILQEDVEDAKLGMKQIVEEIISLKVSEEKQLKLMENYEKNQKILEERNANLEERLKNLQDKIETGMTQGGMRNRNNDGSGRNFSGRSRNDDDGIKSNNSFGDDDDDGCRTKNDRYGQNGRRNNRGGGSRRSDGDGVEDRPSRGGRGGRRDREDKRSLDDDASGGKEYVNKEIYIPPMPEQDEKKIYSKKITAGKNFQKDIKEIKIIEINNVEPPIESFDDANLHQHLIKNIKKCDYDSPSAIQKYAIPTIIQGFDLMACAQTGSGKTAAFVLPIVHKLLSEPRDLVLGEHCEPQCMVVAPTRELAVQIADEFRKFANQSILKIETAYGGTAVGYQAKLLLNGCHILVGTEGRINDFINRGRIKLYSIRFIVLDEADRMLDTGFIPAVERIMDHETMVSKEQRQTLMFSATFPNAIRKLAAKFLKDDYAFIALGIIGAANTDIDQTFYEVSGREKKPKLLEILKREKENNSLTGTIVFVETKMTADFLASYLLQKQFSTTSIHGDRTQSQREKAIDDIKNRSIDVLVATNVGARGLDIQGINHVIQFDLNNDIDFYVHRIGRTGRVGNKGRATSFYNHEKDSPLAEALVKILRQAGQPVPDFLGGSGRGYQPGRTENTKVRDLHEEGNNSRAFDADRAEPEEEW